MPLNPPPLPTETPLVEPDRMMNWFWVQWFVSRDERIESAASTVADVPVAGTGAIGATALNLGTSASLYRVNLYARITLPSSVSSSLTPTFRWTTGGVALSKTYTAMTGNTTATYLVDVFAVRVDANTSLTYETAYASVGAPPMEYSLEIAVERLA